MTGVSEDICNDSRLIPESFGQWFKQVNFQPVLLDPQAFSQLLKPNFFLTFSEIIFFKRVVMLGALSI